MTDDFYWYMLSRVPGIGRVTAKHLAEIFKETPEQIFYETNSHAGLKSLKEIQREGISFCTKNIDKLRKEYEQISSMHIQFVSWGAENYPERLRQIVNPPMGIYVKGRLPESGISISIVGARRATAYGRIQARSIAKALAATGVDVISGMARGIDSEAHSGAMDGHGYTCAVLGCGVDICYPPENRQLYQMIAEKGGMITEFLPGTPPKPEHFPMRNRIISALSDGIAVIEARERSGSLITANIGLEQGKDIYAVPGRITDSLSIGCNNLIRAGAKLIMSAEDILNEYGLRARTVKKNNIVLDNYEKVVYASMCLVPKSVDEICRDTGQNAGLVMQALISLEIKEAIRCVDNECYILNV